MKNLEDYYEKLLQAAERGHVTELKDALKNIKKLLEQLLQNALKDALKDAEKNTDELVNELHEKYNFSKFISCIKNNKAEDALELAYKNKHPNIFNILVEEGFLSGLTNPDYRINLAVREERLDIIEIFLKPAGLFHNAILMAAVKFSKINIIEFLIKNKVDLEAKDHNGKTALFSIVEALSSDDKLKIAKMLIDAGADTNIIKNWQDPLTKNTMLHDAAVSGNLRKAQFLIEHNIINVDATNNTALTPLMSIRKYSDSFEVMKFLIESGAQTDEDYFGETLLHAALTHNHRFNKLNFDQRKELVELIINTNKDIWQKNSQGLTPLELAIDPVNLTRSELLTGETRKLILPFMRNKKCKQHLENFTTEQKEKLRSLFDISDDNPKENISQDLDIGIIPTVCKLIVQQITEPRPNFLIYMEAEENTNLIASIFMIDNLKSFSKINSEILSLNEQDVINKCRGGLLKKFLAKESLEKESFKFHQNIFLEILKYLSFEDINNMIKTSILEQQQHKPQIKDFFDIEEEKEDQLQYQFRMDNLPEQEDQDVYLSGQSDDLLSFQYDS